MEKRTIGGFIAALRKANGMTQKELADRLNVSDKTVSRWERDEGAPDLAVIPVIAEIFGVTCDELLRGQRNSFAGRCETDEETKTSPKGIKERQRILAASLSHYKTKSMIAMGISLAGLIAAMICNLGLLRAYIGFFVGTIFFLTAIICQAIFMNQAFLSVSDDSFEQAETNGFKQEIIRIGRWSVGLSVILLGACVPLILLTGDAYVGLTGLSWLVYGVLLGGIFAGICGIAWYFIGAALLRKGIYRLSPEESSVYWAKHGLQRKCAIWLVGLLTVTLFVQLVFVTIWDAEALSEHTVFTDYDSFVAYMEQDIPYEGPRWGASYVMPQAVAPLAPDSAIEEIHPMDPDGNVIYYDRYGNEITEEEALTRQLTDDDGTVLVQYVDRNKTVGSISYRVKDGSALPITVTTHEQLWEGTLKGNLISLGFGVAYCAEAVGVVIAYFCKKKRLSAT